MISLFDYIIESLINSKELINNLTFKECSYEDFLKTVDTDEFGHGKELSFKDIDEMKEGCFLLREKKAIFYHILYKEHIIGFFGLFYLKNDIRGYVERHIINILLRQLSLKDNGQNYWELFDNGVYVINWQISQSIKKKLDINDFALLKVFYSKLEEMLKKENIKYIYAHGKDDKLKKAYVKVGKFKDFKKEYGIPKAFEDDEDNDIINNFVVKII